MSYRLGVDVGGTFTDLLLISEESGETFTAKVPSTPEDSSVGVLNGIARICDESGVDPKQINRVMHGTTVATNAVLQGKGARVGLVTTRATSRRCRWPALSVPAVSAAGSRSTRIRCSHRSS